MHIAKCEWCGKEVQFRTYRHHWPKGWVLIGISRWGKKHHKSRGWASWCPAHHKKQIDLARRAVPASVFGQHQGQD